jgi:hypothetical protein
MSVNRAASLYLRCLTPYRWLKARNKSASDSTRALSSVDTSAKNNR